MPIEAIIRVVFVISAVTLVGMILLQRGKGTDIGASFGAGAAQTLFGPTGSAGLLVKVTTVLAVLFFVSSFALAFLAKQRVDQAAEVDIPDVVEYVGEGFFDGVDADVPLVEGERDLAPDVGDAPDPGPSGPAGP